MLLLRGAHFWWGQFEHSVTRRPLPRVHLLARTSVSLTLLPHWQVLVFGAAAAGVCSWAWGWGSSRCLFCPMVGDEGVGVVIVDAFLCVWGSLSHTIHLANHFNFPILHSGQKIQCGYCVTGHNLEEDMSQRPPGQSISPDGGKPLRICRRLGGDNGGLRPL